MDRLRTGVTLSPCTELLLLVLLSFLFCGDRAHGQSEDVKNKNCGPGWEFFHRACYKIVWEVPVSWPDANLDCQVDSGELMSVSDMAELKAMKSKLTGNGSASSWWVGLRRDENKTFTKWLDKAEFSYRVTRWSPGEPNNKGNKEDCVEINVQGAINDKDCNSLRPYICERHEITSRPPEETTAPYTSEVLPTSMVPTTPASTAITTTTTSTPTTPTTTKTITTAAAIPSTAVAATITSEPLSPEETTQSLSTNRASSPSAESTKIDSTPTTIITTTASFPSTTAVPLPSTSTTVSSSATADTTEPPASAEAASTTKDTIGDGDENDSDTQRSLPGLPTTDSATTPKQTPTPSSATTPAPSTTRVTTTTRATTTTTPDLYDVYSGCFMLEARGSRDARRPFLYTPGSEFCPALEAAGVHWPQTAAGRLATVPCRAGKEGTMTFECVGQPTCWRGEPSVDQCASPRFKKILSLITATEVKNDTAVPEPEQTIAITSQLAEVTTNNDVTQEDIAATSKVIKSLVTSGATTKVKDTSEVKQIVTDVVKAGSNLVSHNKSKVWADMAEHDKIRSATSLMVAMETATVAMAAEINEPTKIVTKDENIELELRVVNVTTEMKDSEEKIVYDAENSETQFSIPMQTLSHLSKGGLAKVVFMTHYTMGDILQEASAAHAPANDASDNGLTPTKEQTKEEKQKNVEGKKEVPPPQLASYILSASVSGSQNMVKLPRPISFTMRHIKDVTDGYYSMCSFWKIGDSGMGEWSQDGCRVLRSNATQTTCECDHMTNFAVLMAVQEVKLSDLHLSMLKLVTIVGCIISCLCLLASWITFSCFSSLQGERNSIHKNLVVCLFVAEMLFLTGIDQTQNRLACGVVAGLLHYFFLAAFLWMLLEGVHIILMLVQVFDASRSRMPCYYAAAYAPPVLVIAISAGLYHDGYGTEKYCWLTTERYFIWSFAGPVATILFANTVILIYALTMVFRHSEYVFGGKEKTTAAGIRTWIQGAMALEVLLGLTWVIGFFFLDENSVTVAYVFTILNSTQGLYIFVFHCLCNKKARKEYRRVMKVQRRPSMTTGTGSGTHSSSLKNKTTLSGSSFNRHNSTSGAHFADHYNYHNV